MKHNPLTTLRISYENLCGKSGRSVALIIIVAIMAFALFGGAVLSNSLNNGMRSLEARLGADIAIVPVGSEDYYESVILGGSPVQFYFDKNIAIDAANVAGVQQVTSQFYLATLADAACCSSQIQIVGIDYDTDFVIMPWIRELLHRQIGDGEVIVGRDVIVDRTGTVVFFGRTFNVAAVLERTATGMDSTVFMGMDTARELAAFAQEEGLALYGVDVENAISTILVRVSADHAVGNVAFDLRNTLPYVGVVTSYAIYSSIGTSLNFLTGIINTITIAFSILIIIILLVFFSAIANSRKKEFAVLRVLGATRKKLADIVLTEAFLISMCGAIFGSIFAAIVVFPFGRNIGAQMGMPLLLPELWDSVRFLLFSILLSFAVGPLSAAFSAYKISRAETYATMREGE